MLSIGFAMDADLARLAGIIRTTPGASTAIERAQRLENRQAAELLLAAVADTVCEQAPGVFTPADAIRLRDFLVRMFLPPTRHH